MAGRTRTWHEGALAPPLPHLPAHPSTTARQRHARRRHTRTLRATTTRTLLPTHTPHHTHARTTTPAMPLQQLRTRRRAPAAATLAPPCPATFLAPLCHTPHWEFLFFFFFF